MSRQQRSILRILTVICLVGWVALYLFLQFPIRAEIAMPTLIVLPSLTPSSTQTAAYTPSITPTSTSSLTPTATVTTSPTKTATLSTRVLEIQAIMPGVFVEPTATGFDPNWVVLAEPPSPIDPLPDATTEFAPFQGWYSFESDHPNISYNPAWEKRQMREASRGQYHRTENPEGYANFIFEGEAFRLRYVAAQNMGVFDLLVDGVFVDTIDSYSPTLMFPVTQVYTVSRGAHVLQMHGAGKNTESIGFVLGLDAVHVYLADANTIIVQSDTEPQIPTVTPQYAAKVDLIAAPPTMRPTSTAQPPKQVTVTVVIAYDENGNKAIDPAEGVSGISVRVVETGTNRVIAQGFTDASGYAQLQAVTDQPARVVVPYFSKTWDVRRGTADSSAPFTLLLTPGNQPGLIP